MQSAFVDLGLERDAFLYVTDFLEEQEDSADFERLSMPQPREEKDRTPHVQEADQPQYESHEAEQAPEGTRRWKGRRGRRGRDGRPQHASGGNGQQRMPQPSSTESWESPEAVEESIAAEPTPTPEHGAPGGIPATHIPVLLPGESLSKYGGGPAASSAPEKPAAPRRVYTTSKPSTLIEGPIEWSGGDLLPGESRAWRSSQPAGEATAAVVPEVPEIHHEEAVEAFPEAATPERVETSAPEPAEDPANKTHEIVSAPPAAAEALAEAVPAPDQQETTGHIEEAHEHQPKEAGVASFPPASGATDELSEVVEHVEETHEYEPEEAEASHRIDVAPPSEFRISTPLEETEPEQHDVQETAAAQPEYEVEYQEEEQPSAPAETAAEEEEHHAHPFAPGAGLLEEEVIDEEEYDFEPLQAHADEQDFEDLEEQTLDHEENGADLGAMVRDLHINQRVNFGPEGALAQETEEEEEEEWPVEATEEDVEEGAEEETEEQPQEQAHPQRERRRTRGRHGRRRHTGGGMRRATAQVADIPAITELLKPGQEILVQIAKEPIAKKGARITSHIALPGRFLVFMPTVNHVGVSRKIASDDERYRLKRILISEKGTASGGFIVRTAAEGASEDELRADLRFLINLWNDIKQRSDDAKAPALIYHDLNLVERVLRDQVSESFSTIWVDSETEYERVVRFLNRFQPALVRRVKLYTKEMPLFEQFGIQDEISKALKSKVWLKSGGSIVINQTEALVAIDINTGKYVGKTARLEDTILKTNLDAIPEIVRQIRLRDLGGIIVIDFIDMDERRNRQKVMQALEEELKNDRAPSKVLQFNDFGLVAITRKRVKQSLERTLSVPCYICSGTGMVKSPVTVCNEIYIEMRKMQKHLERNDVLLRVHPEVVKSLKANNARWLTEMEEMTGKTIIVKSDPTIHPEQFDIH